MSAVLLKEIKRVDANAANVLKEAGFQTDADLQTLTRDDLKELFPKVGQFKMRKSIFEIIHKERTATVLLRELNGLIPPDTLRASLSGSGLLLDYLHILKEMKTQMCNVQMFLDAHIEFLDNLRKNPEQQCGKGPPNDPEPMSNSMAAEIHQPGAIAKVKCRKVVHGQTFLADSQLLDQVKVPSPGQPQLQLIESNEDPQVIIVFCPIASRLEPDVRSAMTSVPGGIPVILVLMHHAREPKYTNENENFGFQNIKMPVNVFFHESKAGLLTCHQNDRAVAEIRKKLLDYAQVVVRESHGSTHVKQRGIWPFSRT